MQPKHESIANAGLTLQLDAPALAMGGHPGTLGSDLIDLQQHSADAIAA
jgi:hypothetical protein